MARERIFIVEDERIIVIDLQRRIERLGYQVCGTASTGDEAITGIRHTRPDLVLMDVVLKGDQDGIDIAIIIKKEMTVPVIFLSSYTDVQTMERAKEAKPLGFILKPFKERDLATMLEMALFKSITDSRIREISDTLSYQTSHDTLTGLLNRNELSQRLAQKLSQNDTQEGLCSAIFVDIDHFKIINDSCGTLAGDELLKETGARLRQHLGIHDYAARIGGDDFVIVQTGDAETFSKALLEETRSMPFTWDGKEFPITLTIGIVSLNPVFKNEHEVMIAGTQTVRINHEAGGNRYTVYAPAENTGVNHMSISEWISCIHDALKNNRFVLYQQPIQPLGTGGDRPKLEVLLRMNGPKGEIIPPGDFIPIAERYNLMPSIDRWVIKNSFAAFNRLKTAGSPLAHSIFCVNLSGGSLSDDSIIGFILETAEEFKIPASSFCIELTETNAILNLTSAYRFIYILKERGFTVALDDFGSGFSSFGYLKNLPVDYVKIDGSFIRNMDKDPVDYNMVQAISSMCKVLGLKTIGEYAETAEIIEMLRTIGVDYAQGYGISKPMPLEEK